MYALTNIGAAEFQAGLEEGLGKLEEALALALEDDLEDYAGRAFFSIVFGALRATPFRSRGCLPRPWPGVLPRAGA